MSDTKKTPIEGQYSAKVSSAVGLLFLAAAAGETTLTVLLAQLTTAPNQSYAKLILALSGMQIRPKLATLKQMAKLHGQIDLAALEKLCDEIEALYEHRNNIAHNFSKSLADGVQITITKLPRKAMMMPVKVYTHEQILEFANAIRQKIFEISGILKPVVYKGDFQ